MKIKLLLLFAVLCLTSVGIAVFFLSQKRATKTTPLVAKKQLYVIGIISPGGAYSEAIDGLKDGLAHFGYAEGSNLKYIVKDMVGKSDRAPAMINELLNENPDVIYSLSTPVTTSVKEIVGDRVPVVFNIVGDPIGAGFVENFSAPGGNITGCSNLSAELSGKRLEIFKRAFPSIKKVVTFYDPSNKFSEVSIKNTRRAAEILEITLVEKIVKNATELDAALNSMKAGDYDGIYNTPDAMVVSNINAVIEKAEDLSIPLMGHEETLVRRGATLSYGASFYQLGHQCATLIDDVLGGADPGVVPICTPEKIETVVNLKSLGADVSQSISPEIIKSADKIIQ